MAALGSYVESASRVNSGAAVPAKSLLLNQNTHGPGLVTASEVAGLCLRIGRLRPVSSKRVACVAQSAPTTVQHASPGTRCSQHSARSTTDRVAVSGSSLPMSLQGPTVFAAGYQSQWWFVSL